MFLVKGGHLAGEVCHDLLYQGGPDIMTEFSQPRVETSNTHGTGCTLSAAIAAGLARGLNLEKAVAGAKDYITGALRAGVDYKTGKGLGPVHHFHNLWNTIKN